MEFTKIPSGKVLACHEVRMIEVDVVCGDGTNEAPYRNFRTYWTMDGERVGVIEDKV